MDDAVLVLVERRSVEALDRFVASVVKSATLDQVELGYPGLAENPEVRFDAVGDLLTFLLSDPSTEYSLYWSDRTDKLSAHFLADGAMVFTRLVHPRETPSVDAVADLADLVSAELGYCAPDFPPPRSTAEFRDGCSRAAIRWVRVTAGPG